MLFDLQVGVLERLATSADMRSLNMRAAAIGKLTEREKKIVSKTKEIVKTTLWTKVVTWVVRVELLVQIVILFPLQLPGEHVIVEAKTVFRREKSVQNSGCRKTYSCKP